MRKWILLVAPIALFGCDRVKEPETVTAAAPEAQLPAQLPVPNKEVDMTTKFKPSVIDLGGRQAAVATECDLTVAFSSIGTGTDHVTGTRVRQLIEEDPAVREVEPYVVGREGETVLCIRLRAEGEAERLFDELHAIVSSGHRVRLWSKSGRQYP
jgi:hypothetical protein